jgi:hypothetical protein
LEGNDWSKGVRKGERCGRYDAGHGKGYVPRDCWLREPLRVPSNLLDGTLVVSFGFFSDLIGEVSRRDGRARRREGLASEWGIQIRIRRPPCLE